MDGEPPAVNSSSGLLLVTDDDIDEEEEEDTIHDSSQRPILGKSAIGSGSTGVIYAGAGGGSPALNHQKDWRTGGTNYSGSSSLSSFSNSPRSSSNSSKNQAGSLKSSGSSNKG